MTGCVLGAIFLGSCAEGISETNTVGLVKAFHSFGTMHVSQSAACELEWTNDTAVAVRINSVHASCDCVEIKTFTPAIPPQGVGRISVAVTPRVAGLMDWVVYAQSEKDGALWIFSITANVLADSGSTLAAANRAHACEILNEGVTAGSRVFLDVRSQDAFRQAHIPGSINLPMFAIKTKGFLRNKQIILLNEGHLPQPLLEETRRLKEFGFNSVAVLEGGIRAWQMAGGALMGENTNAVSLATISAAQFLNARAEPGWFVVALQNETKSALPADVTWVVGSLTQAKISKALQQHPGVKRILLATPKGEGYGDIEPALRSFHAEPVFYLSGGVAAYALAYSDHLAQLGQRSVTISSLNQNSSRFNNGARSSTKGGSCCGGK